MPRRGRRSGARNERLGNNSSSDPPGRHFSEVDNDNDGPAFSGIPQPQQRRPLDAASQEQNHHAASTDDEERLPPLSLGRGSFSRISESDDDEDNDDDSPPPLVPRRHVGGAADSDNESSDTDTSSGGNDRRPPRRTRNRNNRRRRNNNRDNNRSNNNNNNKNNNNRDSGSEGDTDMPNLISRQVEDTTDDGEAGSSRAAACGEDMSDSSWSDGENDSELDGNDGLRRVPLPWLDIGTHVVYQMFRILKSAAKMDDQNDNLSSVDNPKTSGSATSNALVVAAAKNRGQGGNKNDNIKNNPVTAENADGNDHNDNDITWIQGVVVDRVHQKQKKKHKERHPRSKHYHHNSNPVAFYCIQPLDAKIGDVVNLYNKKWRSEPNAIAKDPTLGAFPIFAQGDRVLVLVQPDEMPISTTNDDDDNKEDPQANKTVDQENEKNKNNGNSSNGVDDKDQSDNISNNRLVIAVASATAGNQKKVAEPKWREGVIEKVWPGDVFPPRTYQIVLTQHTDIRVWRDQTDIFNNTSTASLRLMQDELLLKTEWQQQQEQVSKHEVAFRVDVGKWCKGMVVEKHVYVANEKRQRDFVAANKKYQDEKFNYAAYRLLITGGSMSNSSRGKGSFPQQALVYRDIWANIRPRMRKDDDMTVQDVLRRTIQDDADLSVFHDIVLQFGVDRLVLDDCCPDYWVDQAITAGSFNALMWLEQDLKFNLDHYQIFEKNYSVTESKNRGRGLLHCLAESANSNRFFEKWAKNSYLYHKRGSRNQKGVDGDGYPLLLDCLGYDPEGTKMTPTTLTMQDEDGFTFFHTLVLHGDIRSLNALISPWTRDEANRDSDRQRLWELVRAVSETNAPLVLWTDQQGRTAADLARSLEHYRMARMLDDFTDLCYLHILSQCLQPGVKSTIVTLESTVSDYCKFQEAITGQKKSVFAWGKTLLHEMWCMHLTYGWEHFISLELAFAIAAQEGNLLVLEWLYLRLQEEGVFLDLLKDSKLVVETTADTGEFTWRYQLASEPASNCLSAHSEELDIVACAVHGVASCQVSQSIFAEEDVTMFHAIMKQGYWKFIFGGIEDGPSATDLDTEVSIAHGVWTGNSQKATLGDLDNFLEDGCHSMYVCGKMKRYKLNLIRDDADLEQRLEVLRWLVFDMKFDPPNVIDVLKWRQCGVLKWMVDKSLLNLDGCVKKNTKISAFLRAKTNRRAWLGQALATALNALSVGQALCFLAVELDDLQSLDYLIRERRINPKLSFQGWNLLHVSALFSRREIAAYLIEREHVPVGEKCASTRSSEGKYACHIALEKGDLLLARFLLKKGCPSVDSNGRSIVSYADDLKIQDILLWQEGMRRREMFEQNVASLCELLGVNGKSRKTRRSAVQKWGKIKILLIETNCLTDAEWMQNGYKSPNKPCRGSSYWDIIDRIAETANAEFLRWFHDHVLPTCYYDPDSHAVGAAQMRSFWKRIDSFQNDWSDKDIRQDILDRLKKEVVPAAFLSLKTIGAKMTHFLSIGKAPVAVAVPIDPIFWRLEEKVQRRRDTKAVEASMETKKRLLFLQYVTDLVLTSAVLVDLNIAEGSPISELESSLLALTSSAALLQKINNTHPVLQVKSGLLGTHCPFLPNGEINMQYGALGKQDLLQFAAQHGFGCSPYGLVCCRGHLDILKWLVEKFPGHWTEAEVLQMIRLAVFFGRNEIVEWLMEHGRAEENSKVGAKLCAALLGAAASGQLAPVKRYYPEAMNYMKGRSESSSGNEENVSPIATVVVGLYAQVEKSGKVSEETLTRFSECVSWIASQPECRRYDGIIAAKKCTRAGTSLKYFFKVFEILTPDEIWKNRADLTLVCKDFLYRKLDRNDMCSLLSFIRNLAQVHGVNIQTIVDRPCLRGEADVEIIMEVKKMQLEQLVRWSPFRNLGRENDICEIDLNDNFNAQGLKLAHCAAACGRVDVLELIGKRYPQQMDQLDQSGRAVETIAKAKGSPDLLLWMERRAAAARISSFLASIYRRDQAVKQKAMKLERLIRLQNVFRGHAARKLHRAGIEIRLKQRKRYEHIWRKVASELQMGRDGLDWESLKQERFNLARNLEVTKEYGETFKMLDEAADEVYDDSDDEQEEDSDPEGPRTAADISSAEEKKEDEALAGEQERAESEESEVESEEEEQAMPGELCDFDRPLPPMDNIKLTKEVLCWIRKTESVYVKFFLRRLEQLASGQRSRILQKNLVGSSTTIYETYLEQKCAQRILWTPCVDGGKNCILVWYVARHKEVSRLMELIDSAEKRSARTFVSAKTLYEALSEDTMLIESEEILLDPIRDVPLKLHQVPRNDIKKLQSKSWVPPLRLTPEERTCVEKDGTVLLLGRSGTGKTLCIANRIVLEGETNRGNPSFKQLFVARSKKICKHVKKLVGCENGGKCKYSSFASFLDNCGAVVGEADEMKNRENHVSFQRYKRELYREAKDSLLDPLVIWTQIRTFIKGPIDAVQKGRPLERDEYMTLGEKKCRLTEEQKACAYDAFQLYQQQLESRKLWDDCDRVTYLLQALKNLDHQSLHNQQYSRIYVDEIQDYSQAEIALFFSFCKEKSLFLAGDNAQSVEEGVDFRFQDLRAVAHSLYQGDKRYIPEKPLSVNRNFRSHAGILNLAAAILERLFTAFPASTHKLKPDEGIFLGPRPGVITSVNDMNGLDSLLQRNPKLHVLMHDENVDGLKDSLLSKNPIIGIRQSKGLEFRDIVIVNFFSDLAEEHQKAWRELLLDREISIIKPGFPQLEGHLKLLYTAITRCSRRLFFLETKTSIAGKAFFRWLTSIKGLAEYQDGSKMATAMTPDEWRSIGVDWAVNGEDIEESPAQALEWLNQAIYCFEQVGDASLLKKAHAHRSSLKIRVELEENYREFEMSDEKEEEIATVAYDCAKEGNLGELFRLVDIVRPKLNELTRDSLRGDVLAHLDDFAL